MGKTHLEPSYFFLQLAVILVTARIFSEISARFNIPTVIGEIFAGLCLGPSLLAWIEPTDIIRLLAEIGIILLLFEVGLETDPRRMRQAGPSAFVVALGGFVVPFVLGFLLSNQLFGISILVSLFIGGTLTATSIGITVRILRDVNRQESREGQIVLGAAVADDILGVLLLAFLYDFAVAGEIDLANLLRLTAYIGLFFIIAPVAAKILSEIIRHFQRFSRTQGLISTSVVALVLLFAWLAHAMGAPELLGGFASGLALSRRFILPFGIFVSNDSDFAAELDYSIRPIARLFTPIFFVTVGLSLNLQQVDWGSAFIWTFSLSVAFVAIIGKIVAGYLLIREHWLVRNAVGMAMVPRGEVGLIFAELGRRSGILDVEIYAGLVIVIAYTTLFSPFWIKIFYRLFSHRPELRSGEGGETPL
jgi:Kef-type K+ transport system membrane component KefB